MHAVGARMRSGLSDILPPLLRLPHRRGMDRNIGTAGRQGDWFEIKLERERSLPRAWQLPLANNYTPQRPMNVVEMNPLAESSEIVGRLEEACVAVDARSAETGHSLAALLSTDTRKDLRVTALDVGQAACVVFSDGSQPFGYFDVGAPMFFNQRSFPKQLDHRRPLKAS
jgi:hypothetical protein